MEDTSKESTAVLTDSYRRMTAAEKFNRIFDAYAMGKELSMAGLRQQYPDLSPSQIWMRWAQKHLGPDLFEKVYGNSRP